MATKGERILSLTLYTSLLVALFFVTYQMLVGKAGAGAQPHLRYDLVLRAATRDDLDDITRIVQAGFPDDPEVNYRFPHREQYPADYMEWTRKEYENYLDQPKKFVVHLIEAPSESDGEVVMKPAALAVWDIAVLTKSNDTGIFMFLNTASVIYC